MPCFADSSAGGIHKVSTCPKRVDGEVVLTFPLPIRSVETGPMPALRRSRQRPAVEDDRRRLRGISLRNPDQDPEIGDDRREDVGIEPAARLLIDRVPGREIVGHEAPRLTTGYRPLERRVTRSGQPTTNNAPT